MRYQLFYRKALKVSQTLIQQPERVLKLIKKINVKAENNSKVASAMEKQVPFWKERMQLLSRMIKAYVEGRYEPGSYQMLVRGLVALVYFLWLFDLIPDVIPVLGYLDDATVLAWLLSAINEELNRFRAWEQKNPD